MGKAPKKRSLADKVRKTKTSSEIKNNPFEVKINRKKFDVLGRKSKHDVGLPGVSRSKAVNKVRHSPYYVLMNSPDLVFRCELTLEGFADAQYCFIKVFIFLERPVTLHCATVSAENYLSKHRVNHI